LGDLDGHHPTGRVLDTTTAKTGDLSGSSCGGVPVELEWHRQFGGHKDAQLAPNPQLQFRGATVPKLATATGPGSDLANHARKHGPGATIGRTAVNGFNI